MEQRRTSNKGFRWGGYGTAVYVFSTFGTNTNREEEKETRINRTKSAKKTEK